MLISVSGGVKFSKFLSGILVASVLGLLLNALVIIAVFRDHFLSSSVGEVLESSKEGEGERDDVTLVVSTDVDTSSITNATPQHSESIAVHSTPPDPPTIIREEGTVVLHSPTEIPTPIRLRCMWLLLCFTPLALITADEFIGLGWMVLFLGMVLFFIDNVNPDPILARIDGKLLLFFAGLFVSVTGLGKTDIPDALLGLCIGDGVQVLSTAASTVVFIVFILGGSNTISNVPLVLLLSPKLTSQISGSAPWILLAFASTVSGNLTLLGSVANLIVAEVAHKNGVDISFSSYAQVGVPSTLLLLTLLSPFVVLLATAW